MNDERDCTLYVSSLPDKVTEKLLTELFSQAGPVENVSLKKGFGFVTFIHHVSIPYTLKLFEGLKLFGRQIVMKPREGSMYANQFNQRRPGNSAGNRDPSTPSTSFNSRQSMNQPDFGNHGRNITPLLNNSAGTPNFNQQWGSQFNNASNNPNPDFQQRPNSMSQMGFSGNADHRSDRGSMQGSFRDHGGRNSFDGKFAGFRGGRDQTNGRQSGNDSGSKAFRGNNAPNWSDSGASKDYGGHAQGAAYGRRDSHNDRSRYNDRQGSNFSGDFRSHGNDWSRGQRSSFRGNNNTPSGAAFDRNRRDSNFSQRSDRSGHGGYRPHHNDKPYNRQQNARFSHDGFSKNDASKFGSGGRRP